MLYGMVVESFEREGVRRHGSTGERVEERAIKNEREKERVDEKEEEEVVVEVEEKKRGG